jgi:hypothetical protein
VWRQIKFDAVDDIADQGQITLDQRFLVEALGLGSLVNSPCISGDGGFGSDGDSGGCVFHGGQGLGAIEMRGTLASAEMRLTFRWGGSVMG